MKVTIEQVIAMARKNDSLQGVIIKDLQETQVRAVDALLLAENGIVLPEQNIYYNDADIAYDAEFDAVEWSTEPLRMTWEEKMQLSAEMDKNNKQEAEVSVKLHIADKEVRQWVNKNQDKMGRILENFITDIYKANQIIKE